MCEFNLRNYWCQKLCAGGGGFKSGGLPGLQTACIYRSQELRSEIGSMLQVLFRFQLQPILINWLLSSPAKWGSALINGHTQTGSHSQKHTDTLSLFRFFCITACDQHTQTHIHTHTRMHGCKTIQMCLINAHSAWEQDLHYFTLCSFNWSQDKMISEGVSHVVVIFLFVRTEPDLGISSQGEEFALGCVFLWSWFWSWNL